MSNIQIRFFSSLNSAVPTVLLLDEYPNAKLAYSMRKLKNSYQGSCIRVRRSSDNAEQDIGFSNNELDQAALLSFVGANDGFVTVWYNQETTSNKAFNITAINQPRIVSSGVVETVNGKPAIFAGSNSLLTAGDTSTLKYLHDGSIRSSTVTVMQTASVLSGLKFLWLTGTSGGGSIQAQVNFSGTSIRQQIKNATVSINNASPSGAVSTSSDYLVWQTFDAANPTPSEKMIISLNGGADINNNAAVFIPSTANSTKELHMFNYQAPVVGLGTNGYCQEMIFWEYDYTGDKDAISDNINNYYGIY